MARYLVRQRQFIEHVRTMYGRKARWTKWRTLSAWASLEVARMERGNRSRVGLQQTIVTLRGKVVVDYSGRTLVEEGVTT